jgi:hypothetical protein
MAQVLKKRRLVNVGRGRGRRNLTPKQIKFFGTKRQKAALKNRRRRNVAHPRRRHNQQDTVHKVERAAESAIDSVERMAESAIGSVSRVHNRRRKNVGEILTIVPANPGRKRRRNRKMARTANRRRAQNRSRNRGRVVNRRRRNRTRNRHRNRTRMSNPRVVVRYRNRRRNSGRRRNRNWGRRRNPAMFGVEVKDALGVIGGAYITGIITGFLPSNLMTGAMGYIATGLTAVVAGGVVGQVTKDKALGMWVTIGGMVIVGLQLLHQFMPQLQLPFTVAAPSVPTTAGSAASAGTSGMGLITSSNFYVPQVNIPGSMATFVTPAGVTAAMPVAVPAAAAGGGSGMGQIRSMRRIGRLR